MQNELAAVNSLLVAIGESPQNTLDEDNVDITIAREIINRFRKLHISLKNGDIPEPEAKDDPKINWMCRYCDYREECEMDVSVSSLPVK